MYAQEYLLFLSRWSYEGILFSPEDEPADPASTLLERGVVEELP